METTNFGNISICCKELYICVYRDEFRYYPHYNGVFAYCKEHEQLNDDKLEFGKCLLYYCPFCGRELPKTLYGTEERANELERFNLQYYSNPKQHEGTIDQKSGELLKKRCSPSKLLNVRKQ